MQMCIYSLGRKAKHTPRVKLKPCSHHIIPGPRANRSYWPSRRALVFDASGPRYIPTPCREPCGCIVCSVLGIEIVNTNGGGAKGLVLFWLHYKPSPSTLLHPCSTSSLSPVASLTHRTPPAVYHWCNGTEAPRSRTDADPAWLTIFCCCSRRLCDY